MTGPKFTIQEVVQVTWFFCKTSLEWELKIALYTFFKAYLILLLCKTPESFQIHQQAFLAICVVNLTSQSLKVITFTNFGI